MNRKILTTILSVASSVLLLSATVVNAAETSQQRTMQQGAQQMSGAKVQYESDNLIGMQVTNPQGDKLGKIRNLAIGSDGRITYAVLGTGGIAGVGETELAVPWNQLQVSPEQDQITLDVSKERLTSEFAAFEEVRGPQPARKQEQESESMMGD
jgi:hypothetical protein